MDILHLTFLISLNKIYNKCALIFSINITQNKNIKTCFLLISKLRIMKLRVKTKWIYYSDGTHNLLHCFQFNFKSMLISDLEIKSSNIEYRYCNY